MRVKLEDLAVKSCHLVILIYGCLTLLDVRGPTMQKCREALFLFISSISFLFMTFGTLYEVTTYMNIEHRFAEDSYLNTYLTDPGVVYVLF